MNKVFLATAMAVMAFSGMNAQVDNRAINFTEAGTVDCGAMPDLNGLSSYSLQFWFNPNEWKDGATLMSRDDFSVKLKDTGLLFKSGNSDVSVNKSNFKEGEWTQITMICDDGNTRVLVNDDIIAEGLLKPLSESKSSFILGGGYSGLLDEIRIWNEALDDSMKQFDYFTHNTLNKWCPMWDNLVAYYKMDQKDCPYLVDYKGIETPLKDYDNHGILSEGVSKTLSLNDKMPYLVNAAYTENSRFFDRVIPKEQYLLSNEIIILGADCVAETGEVRLRTPNNHASIEGEIDYLENFVGRSGVVSLNGNNKIIAPSTTWNSDDQYGFETWIYLEEWTPGAYILRKESEDGEKGISLRLGENLEEPNLICRVNGNEFVSQKFEMPLNEWCHIGFSPGSGGSVIRAIMFFLNEKSVRPDTGLSTSSLEVIPVDNEDFPIYIGEGLKAKLDETAFWTRQITIEEAKRDMYNMPMPSLTKNVVVENMTGASAYYKYDNKDNLGHSFHSQDEWANIMRSAYEGHYPAKISLSVRGHGKDDKPGATDEFNTIMNTPEKRERFAKDLAEISKNYDGVELDLEWVYNATGWSNFNNLSKAIIAALPEGKTFRISTHNVTYAYPKGPDGIDNERITGFTFQQYGPQKVHFNYVNGFTKYVQNFLDYGYPADKIMTSYSTTTSKGDKGSDILGVRSFLNTYEPSENDIDSYSNGNDTWYYMGPMQVYKRAKYTRQQNLQGIFYWDMGNDYWEGSASDPVMPKYNSAKYCSYGINANTDTIVNHLTVNHYKDTNSIDKVEANTKTKKIHVYPSPADSYINVSFSNGEKPDEILIYSLTGALMTRGKKSQNVDVSHLASGIYMLNATDQKGFRYKTKFVKR